VSGIIQDRLAELHAAGDQDHPLLQVRQEFQEVLYAHPEAGGYSAADFNKLFSAAFAQTLAFGLLLVREAGEEAGVRAWEHMPPEHPLMQTALRVLSLPEVVRELGVGFEVMCDTVNSFAPEILAAPPGGTDPILYFYEYFLATFDPEQRRRLGVYYTPVEVVRYMVGALDRALRDNLGTQGLGDPQVTILDPAAGTGTFLLEIAERVRAQAVAAAGDGAGPLAMRDLARRMFGFELLVGPYAVAHYRLHHRLGWGATPDHPRLGIYLADTLAEPGAAAPVGALGFVAAGIAEERREANRIKSEQPILAITGNPPYRRLREGENETLVGRWMDHLWEDLKEPVSRAGHGNQLNTFPELSVAFWRWAMWKLFEADNAPRRGVVAFISNRKFLTGWPYAGLRKMMRQRFDRIEIIDLRGDVRLGEPAGVDGDQGVFDIQVGTAITIAIADGSKAEGEAADVYYHDSWAEGLFSRRAKFEWLVSGADVGTLRNATVVDRGSLDDMRPRPFQNGEWANLVSCFEFRHSGVQTKRDEFVYSPSGEALTTRLLEFKRMSDDRASVAFPGTAARPWKRARAQAFDDGLIQRIAYRPLDRRWLYNNKHFIDRRRPDLQEVWGAHEVWKRDPPSNRNFGLYAMPFGTGAGPAVWCHGLLPDYHSFRGSYGGYAFPLYDRRPRVNGSNLSPAVAEGLGAAYGEPVAVEDVFDAILCLLSAASYTRRFADDLENTFPHVPFPARSAVFQDAARIGRDVRAVETFSRPPAASYRRPGFARVATEPRGAVAPVAYVDGGITLCADGSGRITHIPEAVWNFAVSGYRVLPRWIESRKDLPADLALVTELRDICSRIAELIDLFAAADTVLDAALRETLPRHALGLDTGGQTAG
jgi:predicted helicase